MADKVVKKTETELYNEILGYAEASDEVKESIQRRAKIYDFTCEGAIEKFWESINFDEIKPAQSIYEGLENVIDERERNIRAQFRSWRSKRS